MLGMNGNFNSSKCGSVAHLFRRFGLSRFNLDGARSRRVYKVTPPLAGGRGPAAKGVGFFFWGAPPATSPQMLDSKQCILKIRDTGGELDPRWIEDGKGFILVYSVTSRESFDHISKIQHL